MNTEQLGSVLYIISPALTSICTDSRFVDCVRLIARQAESNLTDIQKGAALVGAFTPLLLGEEHREDTFSILAAFRGKTVDEIRKQSGLETLKDLKICFSELSDLIQNLGAS